jgi:formate hydrogenlyase subunit 6/NADH:ubiquinone oxidoreductase subunit I
MEGNDMVMQEVRDVEKKIAAILRLLSDSPEPLGGRIAFDHEKCDGCGLCSTACCGNAVEMR